MKLIALACSVTLAAAAQAQLPPQDQRNMHPQKIKLCSNVLAPHQTTRRLRGEADMLANLPEEWKNKCPGGNFLSVNCGLANCCKPYLQRDWLIPSIQIAQACGQHVPVPQLDDSDEKAMEEALALAEAAYLSKLEGKSTAQLTCNPDTVSCEEKPDDGNFFDYMYLCPPSTVPTCGVWRAAEPAEKLDWRWWIPKPTGVSR